MLEDLAALRGEVAAAKKVPPAVAEAGSWRFLLRGFLRLFNGYFGFLRLFMVILGFAPCGLKDFPRVSVLVGVF